MGSMCQYLRKAEEDFAKAQPTKLLANINSSQRIRQAFRIGEKCLVGISWRSVNKSTGLMRSLSLTEFLEPFVGKDVENWSTFNTVIAKLKLTMRIKKLV